MISTSTQNYIEILEKTNQQLSLWYNPYGLIIGVLTLLVALLALYFGYILWRQGRDYKDFLEEQRKIISEETRIYAKSVLDERIAFLNVEISTLTGEARNRVEQEIISLNEASKSLNKYSIRTALRHRNSSLHDPLGTALKSKIGSDLTEAQILSIISLLESFGAKMEKIKNVENSLRNMD